MHSENQSVDCTALEHGDGATYAAFVERRLVVLCTRRSESYCTEMLARGLH